MWMPAALCDRYLRACAGQSRLRFAKRQRKTAMKSFLTWGIIAMSALASSAHAATFVYVSNAEDGEIAAYAVQPDGTLRALARTQVAKTVMRMAVSRSRRLLYAASRAKPY